MIYKCIKMCNFTAIEIIAVLTIAGILSAMVIGKTSSAMDSIYGKAEVNQLATHLTFVQAYHMNNEVVPNEYSVTIIATSVKQGYTLTRNGNDTEFLFENAQYSTNALDGVTIQFDSWGRLAAALISPLVFNGTVAEADQIVIEEQTGYISVQ